MSLITVGAKNVTISNVVKESFEHAGKQLVSTSFDRILNETGQKQFVRVIKDAQTGRALHIQVNGGNTILRRTPKEPRAIKRILNIQDLQKPAPLNDSSRPFEPALELVVHPKTGKPLYETGYTETLDKMSPIKSLGDYLAESIKSIIKHLRDTRVENPRNLSICRTYSPSDRICGKTSTLTTSVTKTPVVEGNNVIVKRSSSINGIA